MKLRAKMDRHTDERAWPPAARQALRFPDLFAFERKGKLLGRMPMVVRWKLDQCGVKIGLRTWCRLAFDQKAELVERPCGSERQRAQYRRYVCRIAAAGEVEFFQPEYAAGPHADAETFLRVAAYLQSQLDLRLARELWNPLTELQKFTLAKLTRAGHENAFLQQALLETGLITIAQLDRGYAVLSAMAGTSLSR